MIIDIHSRYVPGFLVAPTETGELAKTFIAQTIAVAGAAPRVIHADRGTSKRNRRPGRNARARELAGVGPRCDVTAVPSGVRLARVTAQTFATTILIIVTRLRLGSQIVCRGAGLYRCGS